MFRNTLTPNDKYPVRDCENLWSPIQTQLSLKPKPFSDFFLFFCYFWNVHQILNILEKKMIAIPTFLQKLQAVKDLVRPLSKKQCFRTPFDSEHVKQYQTLVQSA